MTYENAKKAATTRISFTSLILQKNILFLQTFFWPQIAKRRTNNALRNSRSSENSAKLCKTLQKSAFSADFFDIQARFCALGDPCGEEVAEVLQKWHNVSGVEVRVGPWGRSMTEKRGHRIYLGCESSGIGRINAHVDDETGMLNARGPNAHPEWHRERFLQKSGIAEQQVIPWPSTEGIERKSILRGEDNFSVWKPLLASAGRNV